MSEPVVGEVIVFTKMMGSFLPGKCLCGFVWNMGFRSSTALHGHCPACGRDAGDSAPCSEAEYKASRKDDAAPTWSSP